MGWDITERINSALPEESEEPIKKHADLFFDSDYCQFSPTLPARLNITLTSV